MYDEAKLVRRDYLRRLFGLLSLRRLSGPGGRGDLADVDDGAVGADPGHKGRAPLVHAVEPEINIAEPLPLVGEVQSDVDVVLVERDRVDRLVGDAGDQSPQQVGHAVVLTEGFPGLGRAGSIAGVGHHFGLLAPGPDLVEVFLGVVGLAPTFREEEATQLHAGAELDILHHMLTHAGLTELRDRLRGRQEGGVAERVRLKGDGRDVRRQGTLIDQGTGAEVRHGRELRDARLDHGIRRSRRVARRRGSAAGGQHREHEDNPRAQTLDHGHGRHSSCRLYGAESRRRQASLY